MRGRRVVWLLRVRRGVADLAEMFGEVQRHCQRAYKTCDTWPPRRRQFPGKEDVQQTAADREIGKTPDDVDDGGGFADAAWRSERRLKAVAADALHGVRNGVGEKRAGEQPGDIDIPGHQHLFTGAVRAATAPGRAAIASAWRGTRHNRSPRHRSSA